MKLKSKTLVQFAFTSAVCARLSADPSPTDWQPAVNIDPGGFNGVNTPALEGCPIESPDGCALFFASNRPGGNGGLDIWVAFRSGPNDAWQEPQNLPINSASDDFCPTPLPGGELFFVSRRAGGCAANSADIYFTSLHPVLGWIDPVHLGCSVNSAGDEFSPSYVPAGGGMLFFSSNRDGLHKIYVSLRSPDGEFDSPAEVAELNSPASNTARPNVSQDGREIVFDSDQPGGFGGADIWRASRSSILDAWLPPVNLGANINSAFPETRPSLSRNGARLYFGSSRPGSQGSSDIHVAER
jgi:Tol biopolymer transport system component